MSHWPSPSVRATGRRRRPISPISPISPIRPARSLGLMPDASSRPTALDDAAVPDRLFWISVGPLGPTQTPSPPLDSEPPRALGPIRIVKVEAFERRAGIPPNLSPEFETALIETDQVDFERLAWRRGAPS